MALLTISPEKRSRCQQIILYVINFLNIDKEFKSIILQASLKIILNNYTPTKTLSNIFLERK